MSRSWMFVFMAMVMIIGLSFPKIGQSAPTPAKKLLIAVTQEPSSIDVSCDSSSATGVVLENINEFLIKRETNGKLTPGLASSWKVSPDGKTIEFTLRKGIIFHSDDPLTAKDVAFSFERTRTRNPYMKTKLRALDKIEVLDEFRCRFLFKTPDVIFIPDRTSKMIVSKNYHDRVGENKFVNAPVRTGPYKFVRYEMGQYIHPEFDKILFEARATVDDTKRVELVKKLVKILQEEVAAVPIFNVVAIYGMQKNIDFIPTRKFYTDLVLVKDITVK